MAQSADFHIYLTQIKWEIWKTITKFAATFKYNTVERKKLLSVFLMTLLAVTMSSQSLTAVGKLSPYLSGMLSLEQNGRRAAAADARVMVLTKLVADADEALLAAKYGFTVEARFGEVLIISIDINQIAALAADNQVVRVEAERPAHKYLDVMPSQIRADKVRDNLDNTLPQAFTGKDVVVGIVDGGFDYINPFFRDAAGKTRIKWAIDYLKTPAQKYATVDELTTVKCSSDAKTEWHGTHVAGIAAGSLVHSTWDVPYQGIASEADIVEAAINLAGNNPILNPSNPTSAPMLLAMKEMFDYAEAEQKPCVINFSAGISQTFAHNRQLEEEALRSLVVNKPGRAIVVAAGNQGLYKYLMHKPDTMMQAGAGVRFHREDGFGAYLGVELVVKANQVITVNYEDSLYSKIYGTITLLPSELENATNGTLEKKIGSGVYLRRLTATLSEKTADGSYVIFLADNYSNYPETDRILLTVEGAGEAWIYADTSCAPLEDVASEPNHSLTVEGYNMGWPASVDEMITVGNIGRRFKLKGSWGNSIDWSPFEMGKGVGYRALSSACGPTLDGRVKPDVCAPGVNIVSAYNNFVNESYEQYLVDETIAMLDTEYEPENGGYFALLSQTGTSMSAPAVTGTIALWMQADPTLTVEGIKDLIAATSRRPDTDLFYPNNEYGHGEIDAYLGLCYILGINKIQGVSMAQPQKAAFRLSGRTLTVQYVATQSQPTEQSELRIYSTDGRLLLTEQGTSINLSTLPHGVYAVQLNTGNKATTGSTLIRL